MVSNEFTNYKKEQKTPKEPANDVTMQKRMRVIQGVNPMKLEILLNDFSVVSLTLQK